MKTVLVNDQYFRVEEDYTILQLMFVIRLQIPRFCFHEQLSIAGNCRICLIEDLKSIKPVIACGLNILPHMVLYTETVKVKKAREAVMEYLLINHPLDCPICDQGGECDLQDISFIAGSDRGRYYEDKRAVTNKNFGPLIKTVMNRCIHCTRCVRFASEVVGIEALGVLGRGSLMEIGFYIDKIFEAGVSGNVIDLCPVGALTSKPYAFMFRSWELRKHSHIDFFDYTGSKILVETRGSRIMRILPYYDYGIGFGFISDKTRFCFDSVRRYRILFPSTKLLKKKYKCSWEAVFFFLKKVYKNILQVLLLNKIKYLAQSSISNFSLDLDTGLKLKAFFQALGSSFLRGIDKKFQKISNYNLEQDLNEYYNNKNYLLLNVNLRVNEPLLNIRLRKAFLENTNFYYIGSNCNFNFFIKHISSSLSFFLTTLEGKNWCSLLKIKVITTIKETTLWHLTSFLEKAKIAYFMLTYSAGWNALLYLNYVLGVHSQNIIFNKLNLMINVGVSDNINYVRSHFKRSLNIFIGTHTDQGAVLSNIILPSVSVFEKKANYVNYLQKVSSVTKIVKGPVNARSEYDIIEVCFRVLFLRLLPLPLTETRPLHLWIINSNLIVKHVTAIVSLFLAQEIGFTSYTKNSKLLSAFPNI